METGSRSSIGETKIQGNSAPKLSTMRTNDVFALISGLGFVVANGLGTHRMILHTKPTAAPHSSDGLRFLSRMFLFSRPAISHPLFPCAIAKQVLVALIPARDHSRRTMDQVEQGIILLNDILLA